MLGITVSKSFFSPCLTIREMENVLPKLCIITCLVTVHNTQLQDLRSCLSINYCALTCLKDNSNLSLLYYNTYVHAY